MSRVHEPGEPCPIVIWAHAHFGKELGEHVLWEMTCFPMDDETAEAQLTEIIEAHIRGRRWQRTIDDDIAEAEATP